MQVMVTTPHYFPADITNCQKACITVFDRDVFIYQENIRRAQLVRYFGFSGYSLLNKDKLLIGDFFS